MDLPWQCAADDHVGAEFCSDETFERSDRIEEVRHEKKTSNGKIHHQFDPGIDYVNAALLDVYNSIKR